MEQLCFALSLLVYFPTKMKQCNALYLIQEAFYNEENICTRWKERNFIPNLNLLMNIPKDLLKDVYLLDVIDDNLHSGVVYYIFEYQNELYYVYRGSENRDELHHTTGWQDWDDNIKLFLSECTPQQSYVQQSFLEHLPSKAFYLCGHSKGGHLAIFNALTMSDSIRSLLKGVVSFNAPGIQKAILEQYQSQLMFEDYQKFHLFESEHDCVSSCFEHIKTPYIIKSEVACRSVNDLYDHHNLYGFACMLRQDYVLCDEKSIVPQMVRFFVNDVYMNRSVAQRKEFVDWMNEAFEQNLSSQELIKKGISKFIGIHSNYPHFFNLDLSSLSKNQFVKKILEWKKKGDKNEGIDDEKDACEEQVSINVDN